MLGRRLACLTVAAGVAGLVGTLAVAPAFAAPRLVPSSPVVTGVHAATPRLVRSLPTSLEPPTPYIPQTDCDATAKPGAVALMNLLLSTYKDARSLGIVSTCAAEKMTSEHSDGRALDFGVNLSNPHQAAEAQAVLTWLFAPDGNGNEQAMARRLGVMYVIWDGRIRSTGGDWQGYQSSTCWKKGKVGGQRAGDVTQCHRNHIHISLAWNGAWKRTSFWTGKVAAVDYGPCIPKGKKVAPKYSKPNPTPCSGSYRGGGTTPTSTPRPTLSAAPTTSYPTDAWPTDAWPTDVWPTDLWPTVVWPTTTAPTTVAPTTAPASWTWPTATPTASPTPTPTASASSTGWPWGGGGHH